MQIVKRQKIWFSLSGLAILSGLALVLTSGIPLGLDFTGGSALELKTDKPLESGRARQLLDELGIQVSSVVQTKKGVLIKTQQPTQDQNSNIVRHFNQKAGLGEVSELRFESIGPSISKDLTQKAVLSITVASLAIVIYIAWSFRKVNKPISSLTYGLIAVITLIHDVVIAAFAFILISRVTGWPIDTLFITALLTVMGFSVHDTIVVFDRIRENVTRYPSNPFESTVELSIDETFMRSINTSTTTLVALLAIILLGGPTIKPFVTTMFIGILVGTYSSIFIASPLLTLWLRHSRAGAR